MVSAASRRALPALRFDLFHRFSSRRKNAAVWSSWGESSLAITTDLSHIDFKQRDSNIHLIITSFVGGQMGQRDGLNVTKLIFIVNGDKL